MAQPTELAPYLAAWVAAGINPDICGGCRLPYADCLYERDCDRR